MNSCIIFLLTEGTARIQSYSPNTEVSIEVHVASKKSNEDPQILPRKVQSKARSWMDRSMQKVQPFPIDINSIYSDCVTLCFLSFDCWYFCWGSYCLDNKHWLLHGSELFTASVHFSAHLSNLICGPSSARWFFGPFHYADFTTAGFPLSLFQSCRN